MSKAWMGTAERALLISLVLGAWAACGDSVGNSGTGGAGGDDGAGNGTASGANGAGGFVSIGGGTPMFETDIIPILAQTCGSTDKACHAQNAYAPTPAMGCRGWLALENKPLGSEFCDENGKCTPTPPCPDLELYRRLLDLTSWEECNGQGVPYVKPCDPDGSYVWNKIQGSPLCGPADDSDQMPPDKMMDPYEKETIRQWILAGAPRIDGTVDACAAPDPTTSSSTSSMMGQPPAAFLTHPGSDETRPADTALPFIGNADDPEDGALTGSALQWSSNIDGVFGTGENFSALLSPGTHTITLQAADSDGNTSTDEITNLVMTP
jgi:hypothetical protein